MRHAAVSIVAWFMFGACHIEEGALVMSRPDLGRAAVVEHRRMHARFNAASRIEHAIAFSDLERAHTEARDIAALDLSNVSEMWRPYFDSLRDVALQVESSRSLGEAARLTATLGQRCANCHLAIAARVEFPAELPPSGGPKLAAEMQGHQWAATQMWRGLIGPSSEHWTKGAHALTTARLTRVAQSPTPDSELDIDDVARIRLYANRAITMSDPDARVELFGTLLTTCAHCHAVLRDR
jgi:hypothetical protein